MSDSKSDIWRLQAQFDIQGLIEALKQDDTGIRKRAAAALRAIGAKQAVPALRVALVNEQDSEVRAILASALDTLSDINEDILTENVETSDQLAQITHLIDNLQSDDPDQVIDAATQLGEFGDKIAVEPLVMIFNNMKTSIRVRLAVAEALLKLEGAPVEVALLAALRHNDWHIRRNGAAILGQLKAEWAVEPLTRALRDPHSTVRKTARAALQRIGTPEAIEALHRRPSTAQRPAGLRKARPLSTTNTQETIPSAPRDGLLNRLQAQQRQYEEREQQEKLEKIPEDRAIHKRPTKPLDPSVLDELKRREEAKSEELSGDDAPDETE